MLRANERVFAPAEAAEAASAKKEPNVGMPEPGRQIEQVAEEGGKSPEQEASESEQSRRRREAMNEITDEIDREFFKKYGVDSKWSKILRLQYRGGVESGAEIARRLGIDARYVRLIQMQIRNAIRDKAQHSKYAWMREGAAEARKPWTGSHRKPKGVQEPSPQRDAAVRQLGDYFVRKDKGDETRANMLKLMYEEGVISPKELSSRLGVTWSYANSTKLDIIKEVGRRMEKGEGARPEGAAGEGPTPPAPAPTDDQLRLLASLTNDEIREELRRRGVF